MVTITSNDEPCVMKKTCESANMWQIQKTQQEISPPSQYKSQMRAEKSGCMNHKTKKKKLTNQETTDYTTNDS